MLCKIVVGPQFQHTVSCLIVATNLSQGPPKKNIFPMVHIKNSFSQILFKKFVWRLFLQLNEDICKWSKINILCKEIKEFPFNF